MLQTQRLAASIVGAVIADGRNLNAVLAEQLSRHLELTAQQRAAITDMSYGTLRFGMRMEAVLAQLLTKPLTDAKLRWLLLVALYQLEYTRAAQHAIVDHAVRATAGIAPYAKGLVNAVLRNFLRQRETVLAQADKDMPARVAYPPWWVEQLRAQYPDNYIAMLEAGNQHPPFTLRVNRRYMTRDGYLAQLTQQGIEAKAVGNDSVILTHALPVERVPAFMEGGVSVQDAGAQCAAPLLEVADGMRVLDACAAPGGKSGHLLELADIELTALDNDAVRLERVQQNLARLNLKAGILCGDAAHSETWWDGKPFDRILADVPCSASGVVRRHPDIKWLRRPGDIAHFAEQQQKILNALWPLLAVGGKLLYTTCSVFREENAQQIATFLARHSDAKQQTWRALGISQVVAGQLLPNHEHDGFFYALLEKR